MIINLDRIPVAKRYPQMIWKTNYTDHRNPEISIQYYLNQYTNTDELIYLVYPNNIHFIKYVDIHTYIPDDIIEKIRERKIILAFNLQTDAYKNAIQIIYDFLILKENLHPRQILLIMNSPDLKNDIINFSKKKNIEPFRFEFFSYFERYVNRSILLTLGIDDGHKETRALDLKSPLINNNHKKKFINLTGTNRYNRLALLLLLSYNSNINDGYISFPKNHEFDNVFYKMLDQFKKSDLQEKLKSQIDIKNILPLTLDTNSFHDSEILGLYRHTMVKFYNNSYFSVVNETHFDNDMPYFPTEKIFKAIFHKHPFVLNSTPEFLKGLRNQGYQTYAPFIDESYDEEYDENLRILKIAEEVKRLCNLHHTELKKFKAGCLEIANYNFKVLMNKKSFLERLL